MTIWLHDYGKGRLMSKLPSFTCDFFPETTIQYIYPYHPYRNGDGSKNPEFTRPLDGYFLDLKEGKSEGIDYFYKELLSLLKDEKNLKIAEKYNFCAVPSSNKNNSNSPIQKIASKLSQDFGTRDCSDILKRHTSINKLATGGNRNPLVHLKSVKVDKAYDIEGENFILLDDITTSGGSLAACAKLLQDAGAGNVICLALGKTTRENSGYE